jgi:hypothetical protein
MFPRMADAAQYFAQSYAEARSALHDAAAAAGLKVRPEPHPLKGPEGEELATDVIWIGPEDARKLLVSISATHGGEGYCGSGAQRGMLETGRYKDLPADTAVLMIHAINPHGFAWMRRVTEDNVDLNRNFVDFEAPLPENPGYEELHEVICPASWDRETIERTFAELMAYGEEHSTAALQQAISGGQYRHADGIFFGGRGPTWSHRKLKELLTHHGARAEKIAVIDYHTGLGPFGHGERICVHPAGSAARARAEAWYEGDITSTDDGSSTSAPLVGTNDAGIGAALAHAEVTQIALEYGTQPLFEVLSALRGDNWLHVHGDPKGPEAAPIKAELKRCFYPGTPEWCRLVWDRAVQTEELALAGLKAA